MQSKLEVRLISRTALDPHRHEYVVPHATVAFSVHSWGAKSAMVRKPSERRDHTGRARMVLTRDSCLLLPGSLPQEQAALRALGQGLPVHTAIAATLRNALVSDVAGSWSDAERDLRGNATDLPAGSELWGRILG